MAPLNHDMTVGGGDLARQVTTFVRIRIRRQWLFRARCWLGVRLFVLAARVVGCGLKVETTEAE